MPDSWGWFGLDGVQIVRRKAVCKDFDRDYFECGFD